MADDTNPPPASPVKPRYTWPWFLLGAVLLGILLAVAWMSREIERTRRLRELNTPLIPADSNTATAVPTNH